jgi:signal transduction histidine kinase
VKKEAPWWWPSTVGFRARQVAALAMTALAVALVTGLINAAILVRVHVLEAQGQADLLARTMYHMASQTMRQVDPAQVRQALAEDPVLRQYSDAVIGYSPIALYVAIKDMSGVAILHSDPSWEGKHLERVETFGEFGRRGRLVQLWTLWREQLTLAADLPFTADGVHPFGSVVVAVSTVLLKKQLLGTVAADAVVAMAAVLLAFLFTFLLANRLLAPVARLRRELARIDPGGGRPPLDLETEDDVGRLIEFFATASERLAADREDGDSSRSSRRLAALGRLTSGVAHQIRSPLNALVLQVELLRQKLTHAPPETARHLDMLDEEVRRLDHVVQGFLKFIRPEELQLESVCLESLVRETLDFLAAGAEHKKIKLESKVPEELPAIQGNAELLRQVLLNVAGNAFDAMPAGGVLRVLAERQDGHIALTVEDTGQGIAPDDLPKIFDLFYTTKSDGNGIGLSMVYRIVQLHGGEVQVSSERGTGTRVTMTFLEKAA